jgi:hypothetical protein
MLRAKIYRRRRPVGNFLKRSVPVATAPAVINMSSASKAQLLPVGILEYVALAVGLLAFAGAGDDICD